MKIETYKVFSLCDTFVEEDLYDKICDNMNGSACDCYLPHHIEEDPYDPEGLWKKINNLLIKEGAKIGETVLIEMDY